MFQFPGFLKPLCIQGLILHLTLRSANTESPVKNILHDNTKGRRGFPIRRSWIKARSQLPKAYRSVPRPSSPLSAKASTRCSTTLDYSHDQCPLGRAEHDQKKDLSSDFSKRHILLANISGAHGCGPWLVRGTRCPACRICCLFTISNIRAAHPQGEARTSFDARYKNQRNGGACRDRTDDLKLAKLPLSQLS